MKQNKCVEKTTTFLVSGGLQGLDLGYLVLRQNLGTIKMTIARYMNKIARYMNKIARYMNKINIHMEKKVTKKAKVSVFVLLFSGILLICR